MSTVKKPGYMFRACIAWFILNLVLGATLAAIVYVIGPYVDRWYVMIPLLVGIVASEWIIMSETLSPIILDWIKQEEYVKDGEQPSWKKK
jgi:hypothetical protein